MNENAKVKLWGTVIGAVSWVDSRRIGVFQYSRDFLVSRIEVAPLQMPLSPDPYEFPALSWATFRGLPGLLSDSLPDTFGNAIIDAWLATEGRDTDSFHSVERLCYVGSRGMGALEFEPSTLEPPGSRGALDIARLVALSNKILEQRAQLGGVLSGTDDRRVIEDILRVGTSAGGARAKAILAWNPETGEFRSGQLPAGSGFEPWLLKFDGVTKSGMSEVGNPLGYGKVEFVYHQMAQQAGITMAKCRLHEEGGRSHFMTRRFDRTRTGGKIHMQSLGAIAHFDYRQETSYSYEQALQVMKRLDLPREDLEQQVRRAYFNVVARNQDDHVKNIAFLMDRRGQWRLSPAFDVSFAYEADGRWTKQHQMSISGKRDNFMRDDLIALARVAGIKKPQANEMIDRVVDAVAEWMNLADRAGIDEQRALAIKSKQRLTV